MRVWVAAFVSVCLITPAEAGWQSRDSNYNTVFTAGGGGGPYVGPGDVVSGARMWWGLRAYSAATAGTKIANICNASAICADINSTASGDFDIATAQGGTLNCGGAGGTCTIKTFYDQTAGNNCTAATCDITDNFSSANRPTLVFNCIGTKVCLSYNGTANSLATQTAVTSISQPVTFSGIANSTNTGAQQALVTTNGGGSAQVGYRNSANNQVFSYAGSVLAATASDGSFHALQAVFNGGSSDINVDGTQNTGTAGTNVATGSGYLGSAGATQFLNGKVTEAGTWPIGFSSTQSSNMSSNQHSYWGF
jgi:hypothetical protein